MEDLKEKVIRMTEERNEFVTLEDGYVHFWPSGCYGAFGPFELRILADELDRRNKDWDKQVQSDTRI